MPTPRPDETHEDFIDRCIPVVIEDGTATSGEQAVAVCESMWEQWQEGRAAMRARRYVRLTGLADGAAIRTAMFNGAEHVVVPVVALVGDSVVRPMNADGPEFVPAEELAHAPSGWDGRPVLPDHPGGGRASANEPRTLETQAFGLLFNTRFEDRRLKTEAWLDPERATRVGRDAVRVIERARAGEMIEVSVGAWVSAERSSGTADGQRYSAVWRDIVPDHLAMLPEGTEGACSVDMGCGAPRANAERPRAEMRAADAGDEEDEMTTTEKIRATIGSMVRAIGALGRLTVGQDEGMSDADLRETLHDALRADEPAFEGIVEVFPDAALVVYVTTPEGTVEFWRRGYAIADDEVSLADDREAVEPITRYEPTVAAAEGEAVGAADQTAAEAASCQCDQPAAETNGGVIIMTESIKELVGRLIANEASPFTSEDEERLATFCERKLAAMEAAFTPAPEPEEVIDDEVEPEELTEEEWMDAAPEHVREMVARYQAEEAERRSDLIESLGRAQDGFTVDELREKPTRELLALGRALRIDQPAPDYSGRAMPVDETVVEAPRPYTLALEKRREAN